MSEQRYFYITPNNTSPKGPYSLSELERMAQMGEIDGEARVAATGDTVWVPVSSILRSNECGIPDLPPIPMYTNTAPTAQATEAGPCPDCGKNVPLEADGQIHVECPHCHYLFRAKNPHSFWGSIAFTLKKLTVFKGRATRMEFWYFYLFCYLITLFINLPLSAMQFHSMTPQQLRQYEEYSILFEVWSSPAGIIQMIQIALSLIFVLLQLSVTVRRLHDVGKSAILLVLLYLSLPITFLLAIGSVLGLYSSVATVMLMLGLMMLACIFMIVAGIALLVSCCMDSDKGSNKYGISPKYPTNTMR